MLKLFWLLVATFVGDTYVEADSVVYLYPYEYIFVATPKAWNDAKHDCEGRKAVLVKIGSDAVTEIIKQNFPAGHTAKWIGATDANSEGIWKWLDGTSATKNTDLYNKWSGNQPDNWANRPDIEEDCATVNANGEWNDIACTSRGGFVCQRHIIFVDQYQIFFSYDEKNWTQAKAECANEGMHLVKIDSDSLTIAITRNLKERINRWIGANDIEAEDDWKWLDGTSLTYDKWHTEQPNGGDKENFAVVGAAGIWYDVPTNWIRKYICQKSLPITVPHNNHVFTFYRTEKANWDEAKRQCKSSGSRLVEIYDEATNNVIRNNIIAFDADFFCGGHENGGGVTWDSGGSATYASGWATGEPSNRRQTKIALSRSGWKNVLSTESLPFICEMSNLTAITSRFAPVTLGPDSLQELTCSANGVPFSKVFWSFSSAVVTTTASDTVYQKKGNGSSVLHFGKATLNDEGAYTCLAENQAGKFPITVQENFTLTVPSTPEAVFVEVLECSTTINVRWKANSRARNAKHKIIVTNIENASEIYHFPDPSTTIPNETFSFEARKWMMYNISVTPCSSTICKDNYAVSRQTHRRTSGLPGKANNLTVQLLNKYYCAISWEKPSEDPAKNITGFKVTIAKRLSYYPIGSTANESTSETIINGNKRRHLTEGRPNSLYMIGIQAQTCVGLGDIIWLNASCVTEAKAPENVAKPEASTNVTSEGTMNVTINIPGQENGQISCIFVIVKVHEPGSKFYETEYANNYFLEDLIGANVTIQNEYIALALRVTNVTENQLKVTLGDGRVTACKSSSIATRSKRAATGNMFSGQNLKLDQYKNISVFIVTLSPANGEVLLKASESVQIVAIPNLGGGAGGTHITPIIVAVVVVVMVLLLVVIIVVIKKRQKKTETHNVPPLESQYANVDVGHRNEASGESQYADIGEHPYEMSTDVIYQNNGATIPTKKRTETDIPMTEFEKAYNFMHSNKGAAFTKQFEELTRKAKSLTLTREFASKPELKSKNRYKNILPYDNTRVSIRHNDDGYINACFINGFEQEKKFIATQGPLAKTVNDFWLMIAEQKVKAIVMLANCIEAGKKKCERYWPDIGETSRFGSVTVSNIDEVRSCGFVCRTLNLKVKLESEYEIMVSQYHFLTWPDHGFPITTSHILRMHQQVINTRKVNGSTSPIVVHCSAGAGRTGTFIGYDYLLNESKSVGNADVFECVARMRSQRVEMVQNCDQFILVHKLLLETHLFRDTDISRQEVLQKFSDPNYKKKATAEEFANLARVKPMDMTERNNPQKISAYNRMRVKLYEYGSEIAKHLSASYVEAYDDTLKIIVSRQPIDAKVELFWKLFSSFNITAIVMITENEHDSYAYWDRGPEGGEFTVQVDSEQTTPNFTIRKLTIKGSETKSVTHLQLKLNSSQATRKTVSKINECVNRLQKELRELHGAALIHCKTGTGMSAVFCAMMNILERMAVEDRVDVFRAVKDLRDCKEGMIESQAQYALCYEGVVEYLRNFDTYSNFL